MSEEYEDSYRQFAREMRESFRHHMTHWAAEDAKMAVRGRRQLNGLALFVIAVSSINIYIIAICPSVIVRISNALAALYCQQAAWVIHKKAQSVWMLWMGARTEALQALKRGLDATKDL